MNQEDEEHEDNEIKFLGQGTYGCVFNSEIQCSTPHPFQNIKDKRRFVSKVTEEDKYDREIIIGNLVKKIKQYDYYFAPILDTCPINIGIINNEEIQKCDVIKKIEERHQNKDFPIIYVSNKMRFVGDNGIDDYLETKSEFKFKNQERKAIFETHLHLMKALDKLTSGPEPIIHYDMKASNIMFDLLQNVPIIIDFGLSFTYKNMSDALLKPENLRLYFYNDESYSAWTIETQLLSFITINIISNDEDIDEIFVQKYLDDFVDIINIFTDTPSSEIIFDYEEEKIEFRQKMNEYINSFKFMTIKALITDLTLSWKSWDNYAIAVMYKTYLENSSLLDDPYIKKYYDLLKSIVLATRSINGGKSRAEPQEVYNAIIEICMD